MYQWKERIIAKVKKGLFGTGWSSGLEERILAEGNGNLLLISADGANITFTRTGDNTYQALLVYI